MNRWLLALAVVVVAGGCGGDGLERVEILGEITAEGEPISGAVVQFIPMEGTPGEGALGMADESGKFTVISSRQSDEGVPPGKYRVVASRLMNPDGSPVPPDGVQADYPDAVEAVPVPYSTGDSPLEVTISEGGGTVKVEIPAKLKSKR